MKPRAIASATAALERTRRAAARVKYSRTTQEAREAWNDFIMAAGSVYSKLSTGAMGNGRSQAWMGRKRKERKDNEVLNYLHQARNVAEHGIEEVADPAPGGMLIGAPGSTMMDLWIDDKGETHIKYEGDPPATHIATSFIKLVPVKNEKFGNVFEPPKFGIHRSRPMHIFDVLKCALVHLEQVLGEAEEYVT